MASLTKNILSVENMVILMYAEAQKMPETYTLCNLTKESDIHFKQLGLCSGCASLYTIIPF